MRKYIVFQLLRVLHKMLINYEENEFQVNDSEVKVEKEIEMEDDEMEEL